jgi:hypothetical protein
MCLMKKIPNEIIRQVEEIIFNFNKKHKCSYGYRAKGLFLYIDRDDGIGFCPLCRLKFKGKIDNWEFAIYKYSSDKYDPEECFFPGAAYVDGTITGALKAGLEAYPF